MNINWGRGLFVGLVAMTVALTGCAAKEPEVQLDSATIAAVRQDSRVIAEGRVLPTDDSALALPVGGLVAEIAIAEGDRVSAGQELLRVDDAAQQAALAQAEAALALAKAELERVQEGASDESVAAAEAGVAVARAGQNVARAQADAAVVGLGLFDAQVAQGEAALADLLAGASDTELKIAELGVELARNEVWAAQSYRDGVKGAVDRGQAQDYDGDYAEAGVGTAWVAHEIAKQELQRAQDPPRVGAVAAAQSAIDIAQAQRAQGDVQVGVAEAQIASAQAGVAQAQAQVDLTKAGATEAQIAVAEAAVRQAEAGVLAAQVAIEDVALVSPRAGTVTDLNVGVGEFVSPGAPLAIVADLSTFEIETSDLTEIEVVKVSVGQSVSVTPDALPDLSLAGEVVSIDERFQESRGDVVYGVRIRLNETDPRLRWGMTVVVAFDK